MSGMSKSNAVKYLQLTEKCTVCGAPATAHNHYGNHIKSRNNVTFYSYQEQLRVLAAELSSAEVFKEHTSASGRPVLLRQTPVS